MPYFPGKPPQTTTDDGTALAFYLEDELSRLASSLLDDVQAVEVRPAHAAPLRPREGMVVYADGTDWNPGSGEGLYTFGSDSAWHYGGQVALPAAFLVHKNGTNQTGIVSATFTTLTFGTEVYDIGGHFASDAWTPPAGKVHFDATVFVGATVTTGAQLALSLIKNGATTVLQTNTVLSAVIGGGGITLSCEDIANGTDVYSLQIFVTTSAGTATVNGNVVLTRFNGHWISA